MLDLTRSQSATRRRSPRRAVAAVGAGAAAVVALSGCGMTDLPAPRRTVTVTVDAPGATTTSATAAPPESATPTAAPSSSAVPTSLAVGRQRGAPRSFDEAKERIDGATSADLGSVFQSPTGNITCSTSGGPGVVMTCDVAKGRSTAPSSAPCPEGGPSDIGRIELTADGARPVCNSDTIRQGTPATLAYGVRTDTSLGSVACLSQEFGMTCIDEASRHGFFIARDTFVTF
ncbi:hypothetical protein [Humibacillus xanthopallidus]|uniref:hypothetical protein n=1 Tax=Humibacillus xanthopallidus TaxID=412689 RepID=UPI00384CC049